MTLLAQIWVETWGMLLLAAPFVLLGLTMAGFLHVLVPESLIVRWMGRRGLDGAAISALVGVPMPVCSCGVVPIAMELRRKGASRPSTLAFLITTPESSLDSVLLTWGLLGPLMAIVRPLAAFGSAILAAILAIADDSGDEQENEQIGDGEAQQICETCASEHDPTSPRTGQAISGCRLWLRGLGPRVGRIFRRKPRAQSSEPESTGPGLWQVLLRPALRYAFTELLDQVVFWLFLGLLLAGILAAVLPADLGSYGLGSGLLPMLLLIVVGVPLYMCASGSTPVAAALVAKGVSPGAALVLMLTGPATNISTILMLAKTFGRRFVTLYLTSIIATALACGLALDVAITSLGLQVAGSSQAAAVPGAATWVCGLVLLLVSLWRLGLGAARKGIRDLASTLAGGPGLICGPRLKRRLGLIATTALLVLYLGWGFYRVPPDSRGFGFVLGVLSVDTAPGLHWVPPPPFGRSEVHPVTRLGKADIGFRSNPAGLAERRELTEKASPEQWHSSVAAMNSRPDEVSYLTGDEKLVDMSFSVHYAIAEPTNFLFRVDQAPQILALYAQVVAREVVASSQLEELLTVDRKPVASAICQALQDDLDRMGIGVAVISAHIVDIHPPSEAVFAFRDVSSAREDRETLQLRARQSLAFQIPRAHGDAAAILGRAEAAAASRKTIATGRAAAFLSQAAAFASQPELLRHLLWLENADRCLAGRKKILVPAGAAANAVTLWQEQPAKNPPREGEMKR